MRMLATTEQMRELDRTAIEERGIPSLELMENAAREVAQAVADLVGPVKGPRPDGRIGGAVSVAVLTSRGEPLTPEEQREADEIRAVVESKNSDLTQRIALFCGPGNNGGDGIAAARLLFLKGLKIRVMENDIHVALWQALGADAAPMAWGDAFTAMQQGALDGQENPLVLLETNGVPEINKHATKTEHIYNCTITLMSQKLWNEMSEEDRNLIQEVAAESAVKQREICRAEYDRVVKWEQEEMGMTILDVDDKQEWIDATQPVRDEYGAQFADALARIEAAK